MRTTELLLLFAVLLMLVWPCAAADQSSTELAAAVAAFRNGDYWSARMHLTILRNLLPKPDANATLALRFDGSKTQQSLERSERVQEISNTLNNIQTSLEAGKKDAAWVQTAKACIALRLAERTRSRLDGLAAASELVANPEGEAPLLRLRHAAEVAYQAGSYSEAIAYAQRYLDASRQDGSGPSRIEAMRTYNLLGAAYLALGDLQEAKFSLAASVAEVDFSTFLSGPSMFLASRLLSAGERDSVLAYLGSAPMRTWTNGQHTLADWSRRIGGGENPDFGVNAEY